MLDGARAVKHTRLQKLMKDLEVLLDGPRAVKGTRCSVPKNKITQVREDVRTKRQTKRSEKKKV